MATASAASFDDEDLRRILREGAGSSENIDLDGNILDTSFEELGYDSLALLETGGRIEREYGVKLDDHALSIERTPRALVELVQGRLGSEG